MLERLKRAWRWTYPPILVFFLIVGTVTGGILIQRSLSNESSIKQLTADSARDQSAIDALALKLDQANSRLEGAGLPPVSVPVPTQSSGAEGKPGRPPTAQEIAEAIATYCAAGACRGADSAAVTSEQMTAAVAAYCADGRCLGEDGTNGDDGAAGTKGDQGPVGATGAPAPLISGVQCQDDGSWLFTFDNFSTITVTGPCRVDPIIPTPGGTP
ncbi:hypothetical protein [Plantibacter sp. YIM 135249]|uniref:hypothetical protein n=1 Tax=Plantibacter sp. YIM 135249 TaxID=3423918 RepID=UPI003D342296